MAPHYTDDADAESQGLLTGAEKPSAAAGHGATSTLHVKRFGYSHVAAVFVAGVASALLGQHLYSSLACGNGAGAQRDAAAAAERPFGPAHLAAPWAGSTEVHPFPPASPTNAFPELFPTNVGLAGPTPTGVEPALVVTAPALPVHTNAPNLVRPALKKGDADEQKDDKWSLFKHWGNLSPWYSNERGTFGIDSGPEAPEGCAVTGLHLLHRHGARYPTQWAAFGGPADFSSRLNKAATKWDASGELSFMNEWTYKLGEEILTPFGRQQLYDLGVSTRMRYGFLLNNFTESNTLPVFRTESQDRMLYSALNFAAGFFGIPYEGQYQQSITLEAPHGDKVQYNNTLAPYKTCKNSAAEGRASYFVQKWANTYLQPAHARLAPLMTGYELSIEDLFAMQHMCAYETVAIGFSKFCGLFTREEWDGFDYALDLQFWYGSAFGSPTARVSGLGWLQEFIARLTHTPIATHNSTTNSTLDDDPRTFPLGQSLYVDATHEVVVLNILTALNLTTLAATGPLPTDHIPANRSFVASQLAPFATNVQFQLLSCAATPDPQIRVIVNDGVVPLTGIEGCAADAHGRCALPAFVAGQQRTIRETDWAWGCNGDWSVPPGEEWSTTTGDPPAKPARA